MKNAYKNNHNNFNFHGRLQFSSSAGRKGTNVTIYKTFQQNKCYYKKFLGQSVHKEESGEVVGCLRISSLCSAGPIALLPVGAVPCYGGNGCH